MLCTDFLSFFAWMDIDVCMCAIQVTVCVCLFKIHRPKLLGLMCTYLLCADVYVSAGVHIYIYIGVPVHIADKENAHLGFHSTLNKNIRFSVFHRKNLQTGLFIYSFSYLFNLIL